MDIDWTKIIIYFLDKIPLWILFFLAGGVSVFILVFKNPEKVQKWSTLIFKVFSVFSKKAKKKFVSNDIEGRVNNFSKNLGKKIPNSHPPKIKIQWVGDKETPEQFFKDNKLIIRMRQNRDQNENLVNASIIFISQTVLVKTKKYISKSQEESIDLFVAEKLFDEEKPAIKDSFFNNFLSPKIEDSEKIADLIEKYHVIDKAGLFFPVFIEEMEFLGEKIFYRREDQDIIIEVSSLIDFLRNYSQRETGEREIPKNFEGKYCRCGIVIIGEYFKRKAREIHPYINYVRKLSRKKIDNIYLVGPADEDNIEFIKQIGDKITSDFDYIYNFDRKYECIIRKGDDDCEVENFLMLYRNPDAKRYFDEEYQKRYLNPSTS